MHRRGKTVLGNHSFAEPTLQSRASYDRIFAHACDIGEQLCEAAIFDESGRLANWLGRRDIVDDALTARYSVRSGALGPEVYAGSSGIALFLVGLHAATGNPRFAQVASAALRRSVQYLRRTSLPLHPLSFFAGHAGVLCVMNRLPVAEIDGDFDTDRLWLREAIAEADVPRSLDVIAGAAGGILALIDGFDGAEGQDQARRCGDMLCETAVWDDDGCHWRVDAASDGRVSPALAGVAHGGAGMALALLALHRVAPEDRYVATARAALAYTDRLFSDAEGSWVDTRSTHTLEKGAAQGRFQSGWCHGGAGIMLVRRYASTVDTEGAPDHARYAASAASAIARTVRAVSETHIGDASLCHGFVGHSEALTEYARKIGDPSLEQACLDAVDNLGSRYAHLTDWPSGVNAGGPNPSLMIGAAGIGYHMLRLARPGVAPCLLTLFAE